MKEILPAKAIAHKAQEEKSDGSWKHWLTESQGTCQNAIDIRYMAERLNQLIDAFNELGYSHDELYNRVLYLMNKVSEKKILRKSKWD